MNTPEPTSSWKGPSVAALTVAYLFTKGKTQTEIATILNLSQAAVSRLFKEVKDEYTTRTFRIDKLPLPILLEVERRASANALTEKLQYLAEKEGKRGPRVHVVSLPTGEDRREKTQSFANHAAPILQDILMRVGTSVGVAWGNTIWYTTQALRGLPPHRPWRQNPELNFVPLCGDPLMGGYNAERTASRIVSELRSIVSGTTGRAFWLGLVPAFTPRDHFDQSAIDVIDTYIDLVPQYAEIFGSRKHTRKSTESPQRPLAEDLDMILTGAGSAQFPIGFDRRSSPLLRLKKKKKDLLTHTIYGDIGGVLLLRPDAPTEGKQLVAMLERSWTGLRIHHIGMCAKRAFLDEKGAGRRPGVTLLTFGAERASIVIEAVRQGLINQLIIGSDLESTITKMLDHPQTLPTKAF